MKSPERWIAGRFYFVPVILDMDDGYIYVKQGWVWIYRAVLFFHKVAERVVVVICDIFNIGYTSNQQIRIKTEDLSPETMEYLRKSAEEDYEKI